ncbi:MAG: serine hydrolase domain-containing protein [Vicinamibacterales bacterium]
MAVAGLFALAILVAGGAALIVSTTEQPLYTDPAAIPSTAVAEPGERYSAAVEEARRLARRLMVDEEYLPALSVAVGVDGAIVWAEGFGFLDAERQARATPSTRFRTGSVSKTLTAAAVALLHDRGRLDLDAPVQKYVPAYPQKQWTVTTRQLLGDVGGVHRIRGDANDQMPRGYCATVDEALKTFAYEPLLFEPGTEYRFSTSGWILLSAVIEGAGSEPFATFMGREILEPLGMTRTAMEGTAGTDADRDSVPFYLRSNGGDAELRTAPAADYACFFGAGAFLSTPSDLVRFGSAWLKPGLLKAETLRLFQTPVQLKSGPSTFALGWTVGNVPLAGSPARVVRHRANAIAGYVSFTMFPERGLVVAAMSNVNSSGVDPFTLQVADLFASVR